MFLYVGQWTNFIRGETYLSLCWFPLAEVEKWTTLIFAMSQHRRLLSVTCTSRWIWLNQNRNNHEFGLRSVLTTTSMQHLNFIMDTESSASQAILSRMTNSRLHVAHVDFRGNLVYEEGKSQTRAYTESHNLFFTALFRSNYYKMLSTTCSMKIAKL